MWLDQHPLLLFFLVGAFLIVSLILVKVILYTSVDCVIKASILRRNLEKIVCPPEHIVSNKKALLFLGPLLHKAALSWIKVIILWKIPTTLFRVVRDVVTPTPEEIKLLRFPLRNNPEMSRESVWAYVQALQVKVGQNPPDESTLLASLKELSRHYANFDSQMALKQLERLKIINPEVMIESQNRLVSESHRTRHASLRGSKPHMVAVSQYVGQSHQGNKPKSSARL